MNLLDIDIQKYIPNIVDAFSEVAGEEYRETIKERLNRTIHFPYNTLDNMQGYLTRLETYKKRELGIRFLEAIGVDVSKEKSKRYTDRSLEEDTDKLFMNYLGPISEDIFGEDCKSGISIWIKEDEKYRETKLEEDTDKLFMNDLKTFFEDIFEESGISIYFKEDKKYREKKIEFLNLIRGNESTPITEDNFNEFCETSEYSQLLDKIKEYLQIYETLKKEYQAYVQTLTPYQEFVDKERERKKNLKNKYTKELYAELEKKILPNATRQYLIQKFPNINNRIGIILKDSALDLKTYFEYFSEEDEKALNDDSTSDFKRYSIYSFRLYYLRDIGAVSNDLEFNSRESEEIYKKFASQDKIKEYIPTPKDATRATQMRKEYYEKFNEKIIMENPYFIKIYSRFVHNEPNKEFIFRIIKNSEICINKNFFYSNDGPIGLLFMTIWDSRAGGLDYVYCHELWHSIEYRKNQIFSNRIEGGFDEPDEHEKNPYNYQKRKYERMNETLTDIFCREAVEILHNKGIFIMEPEEISDLDTIDCNTSHILKDLLVPFIKDYRKLILRAGIMGDKNALFDVIGEENFEELNDIVNKVDSLVPDLLKNKDEGPATEEYKVQLERLKRVYFNMQNYKTRQVSSSNLFKSAIGITEEEKRMKQKRDGFVTLNANEGKTDQNQKDEYRE